MDNKSLVRAYIEQVWVHHNLAAIDQYISPNYIQHTRTVSQGREGVYGFFNMITSAFSDLTYTIGDIVSEGDKVVWRWAIQGTHTGPFQSIPPTGKRVTITGMSFARVAGDQLAEHWGEQDIMGLMQQLRA